MESRTSSTREDQRVPGDSSLALCLLASGSKGNALWVQAGETRLLVDCGLSVRQLRQRTKAIGADAEQLNAILVSHDHGDHVGGLPRAVEALETQTYCHQLAARRNAGSTWARSAYHFAGGEVFEVGEIEVMAIPLPHDANGTCGFLFEHQGRKAAHLTDLGHAPPTLREALADVTLLSIEANHDERMLHEGPYPEFLKRRVASGVGHLSNAACARLVCELAGLGKLEQVVLAHLSETNNTPEMAYREVRGALDASGHEGVQVSMSAQRTPSGVFSFL